MLGARVEVRAVTGKPLNFPAYEPVPVYTVTVDGGDVYVDPDAIITP